MSNTARLDNVAHADLRIAAGFGPAFGDAVNQMPVFIPEFADVQRNYPILFLRQQDELLQPVAILGLEKDENLFLSEGQWTASYVPAMARRGPFLIGNAAGEPVIHVDLDHPRIVAATAENGLPLFLPQGGHAPALLNAMDALQILHAGHLAREAASKLFEELELTKPIAIRVQVSESQVINFDGYQAITAERIGELDSAALGRLQEAGLLIPAVLAAASLGTMNGLIERKRRRSG